jgi:tripartite-type tricarboxylate transporter receptor subunit TctC
MAGMLFVQSANAEPWPQRPVQLIVPVGPGSGVDLLARLFAERLAERWKQPVIVESQPGADGLIATASFAGKHDDHVLLFGPAAPISVYPFIFQKLGYDPARDIVPIAQAAETFPAIAATASIKIGSLAELVALTKAKPNALNYRTASGAFATLFSGFLRGEELDMVEVTYRQDNQAIQDLGADRIQVMLAILTSTLPQVQAGKVKLLAVTNKIRCPLVPEVPTVVEAGYPQLEFEGLLGFFGPREVSTELRDRLSADVRAVAAEPAIVERLAKIGVIARGTTPDQFSAAIEEQRARMAAIVKSLGGVPTR